MRAGKERGEIRQALATLAGPVDARRFVARDGDRFAEHVVSLEAGTRVRVVMASRLGDVGITDDLSAASGYCCRVQCVREAGDDRPPPDGLLTDITAIVE